MKTKAALMKAYNAPLEVGEVEIPDPVGEAVIVRIAGAGVCHSDLHLWRGEIAGLPYPLPIVLGHENSGYVYRVGDKVPSRLLGKPVLVFGGWYEEEDEYTITGEQQLADKAVWPGILKYHGGYAEYMYVPTYKYLIPAEGIDDVEAAAILTDAGLTPYRAIKKLVKYVRPDDYVIIVGLGGLGIFGLQYAKQLLNARIIGLDILDEKLEYAGKVIKLEVGDILLNPSKVNIIDEVKKITGGKGVKAIVDFVGSRKTLETYLKTLGKQSYYVIVGLHSPMGPEIPILQMVISEVTILGSLWGNLRELYEVVDLAKRNIVKYKELVEKIKLEEINKAFEKLEKGLVLGRQVVVP